MMTAQELIDADAADAAARSQSPELLKVLGDVRAEADPIAAESMLRTRLVPMLRKMTGAAQDAAVEVVSKELKRKAKDIRNLVKAKELDQTGGSYYEEIESPHRLADLIALRDGIVWAVAPRLLRTKGPEPKDIEALSILRFDGADAKVFEGVPEQPIPTLPDGLLVGLRQGALPTRAPSPETLRAFAKGERVSGVEVLARIRSAIDRFVDLGAVPGGQDAGSLIVGAWTMASWLTRAAPWTASYLHLNAGKGSGKSVLMSVLAELVLGGELVSSAMTTPALREMAACGATLLIDEAENIGDARGGDAGQADRRAILLAGTRADSLVTLMLPSNHNPWGLTRVKAHGPRAFASIQSLDDVLGSRTIVIPLVRSGDRSRTELDPSIPADWAEAPARIRRMAALWALGVLRDAPQRYVEARKRCPLGARDAEPWLPGLAVLLMLDAEDGRSRASEYIGTALALTKASEVRDFDRDVLRTVVTLIAEGKCPEVGAGVLDVTTKALAEALDDGPDSLDQARRRDGLARKAGTALSRLRIGSKGTRHGGATVYHVRRDLLQARLFAYGLSESASPEVHTTGSLVTIVTEPLSMRDSGTSIMSPLGLAGDKTEPQEHQAQRGPVTSVTLTLLGETAGVDFGRERGVEDKPEMSALETWAAGGEA